MEDNNLETNASQPKAGWGKWIVIPGVAIAAVAGIGVVGAVSQDLGRDGIRMERIGWGGGHHGMRGGHHGFGSILGELDLTDEQEDKIWAIMDGVRIEARPLMRDFRDSREELAKLLGAATIDRTAVETLRAQRVAQVDEASKKLATAIIAAAEVLTPEQRAKLAAEMEKQGPRW
jgi:protein CpxP